MFVFLSEPYQTFVVHLGVVHIESLASDEPLLSDHSVSLLANSCVGSTSVMVLQHCVSVFIHSFILLCVQMFVHAFIHISFIFILSVCSVSVVFLLRCLRLRLTPLFNFEFN